MLTLGQKSGTALQVVFTNGTGADITGFALMAVGSTEGPAPLMTAGEVLKDGKKALVYTEPAGDALFDVVIQCADKQFSLHDLNFQKMETATIRLEGDIAYVETVIDGNAVSSLNEERDRAAAQAEAEAQAAAAAAGEAAQPAGEAAQPAAETAQPAAEPAEETAYYEEPAPADSPAQSEDTCVSDVVLR